MEVWRDIPGFKNYQVSNTGKIRSLDREILDAIGRRYTLKGRVLKTTRINSGYLGTALQRDGKTYPVLVHRVVAKVFINNPNKKREVNHKNGVRTDNRIENLEWVTSSENKRHSNNFLNKRYHKIPVRQIFDDGTYKSWSSLAEVKNVLGFDQSHIGRKCKYGGMAYGYKWDYENK